VKFPVESDAKPLTCFPSNVARRPGPPGTGLEADWDYEEKYDDDYGSSDLPYFPSLSCRGAAEQS
jgi:hypothetical protein